MTDNRRIRADKLLGLRSREEPCYPRLFLDHLDEEMARAVASGALDAEEQAQLERHLEGCGCCRLLTERCRRELTQGRRWWVSTRRAGVWAAVAAGIIILSIVFLILAREPGARAAPDHQALLAYYGSGSRPAIGVLPPPEGRIYPLLPQGLAHLARPSFLWVDLRGVEGEEALRRRYQAAKERGETSSLASLAACQGTYILTLHRRDSGETNRLPATGSPFELPRGIPDLAEGEYEWWVAADPDASPGRKATFQVPGRSRCRGLAEELEARAAPGGASGGLVARFLFLRKERGRGAGWYGLEFELAEELMASLPDMRRIQIADGKNLEEEFLHDRAEFFRWLRVEPLAYWCRWLADGSR